MKYWAMSLVLAVVLGILSFSFGNGAPAPSYAKDAETVQDISVEEAMGAWRKKEGIFLDVRTLEEYNQGHVPGAVLVPLDELENRLDEITKDKKVFIICRSGNRSGKANIILRNNGFTNTYNVLGGMLAWQEAIEK